MPAAIARACSRPGQGRRPEPKGRRSSTLAVRSSVTIVPRGTSSGADTGRRRREAPGRAHGRVFAQHTGEDLVDRRALVLRHGGYGALDQPGGGVAGLDEEPDARGCQLVGDSAAGLDEPRNGAIRGVGVSFDVRLVGARGGCDVRREAGRQPERCGQRLDRNVP